MAAARRPGRPRPRARRARPAWGRARGRGRRARPCRGCPRRRCARSPVPPPPGPVAAVVRPPRRARRPASRRPCRSSPARPRGSRANSLPEPGAGRPRVAEDASRPVFATFSRRTSSCPLGMMVSFLVASARPSAGLLLGPLRGCALFLLGLPRLRLAFCFAHLLLRELHPARRLDLRRSARALISSGGGRRPIPHEDQEEGQQRPARDRWCRRLPAPSRLLASARAADDARADRPSGSAGADRSSSARDQLGARVRPRTIPDARDAAAVARHVAIAWFCPRCELARHPRPELAGRTRPCSARAAGTAGPRSAGVTNVARFAGPTVIFRRAATSRR